MKIIDNYSHLNFKTVDDINQLKAGMMVQVVEKNSVPPKWKWVELDEKWISLIASRLGGLQWVRVPDYFGN